MRKLFLLLMMLSFVFCKGEKAVNETLTQGHKEHQHEEHKDLKVPLEKQKQWGIEVGKVSEINVSSKISLPGIITLNQNRTAHISSLVEGKIVSLSVDLGDRVKKGQTLLTLNSPQFSQAKAEFFRAKTNLNLKKREFERSETLFERKAIEKKEFLRREAEYSKAIIQYDTARSNLHSLGFLPSQIESLEKKHDTLNRSSGSIKLNDPYLAIITPLSGKIIFRDAIIGEHIEPQKILFTVSELSSLWALLDAYEKDLPYIRKESKARIKSSLYPDKEFEGKITHISDMIDEKLRTTKIRVELNNEENLLKPHMFITGTIENENERNKELCVPEEAVQNLNGEKVVFLQEEEEIFVPQQVNIKEKVNGDFIITEGLKSGQHIVVKGAFYLKAELNKEAFGEAHVH
ncbi:MAG: efflux RND transporter periplasmic adaptor subunit [Candidatus Aminicenantes bacterium]